MHDFSHKADFVFRYAPTPSKLVVLHDVVHESGELDGLPGIPDIIAFATSLPINSCRKASE